ncbi:MAG: NAD(P)-binding protein, partial [Clostridia bacterium]|nr:NAD(P)-binding protein [Clostridia bacterium]
MPNMNPKKNEMPTQPAAVRAHNFSEVALGYEESVAVDEANRCLNCKTMPCVSGCPVNIHIPEFIAKIREMDFEGAYKIITQTSSLPAVCGRVCPQETQCESKCVRGIKGESVGIGRLERFVADYHNTYSKEAPEVPVSNGHKVAVIGSGPSGLTCAGDLAKKGYKVTVLDKNGIIGGGLQTFKRHGVSFPTGMHIFGGFEEGGNLKKIFDYLGVTKQISLRPTDATAFDVITIAEDGTTYCLPRGKDKIVAYLSSLFPKEKDNLKSYFDRLDALSQEEKLFYLQETSPDETPQFSEDFNRPFDALIDRYITDSKLKGLLAYLRPLFGGVEGTTPAYLNALLSVLHWDGTFQFVGGSQQLAEALKKVIEQAGGQVTANAEVVSIMVENHQVTHVVTKDGNTYQ